MITLLMLNHEKGASLEMIIRYNPNNTHRPKWTNVLGEKKLANFLTDGIPKIDF